MKKLAMLLTVVGACKGAAAPSGRAEIAHATQPSAASPFRPGAACLHAHDPQRQDSSETIGFVALFRVHYSVSDSGPHDSWQEYSFQCNERTRECSSGQTVGLDKIAAGMPPGYLDLGGATGATIVDIQDDRVFRIAWGPLRRFTVDLGKMRVTYEERGEGMFTGASQGDAVAPCSP